jgi:hypothetical protein
MSRSIAFFRDEIKMKPGTKVKVVSLNSSCFGKSGVVVPTSKPDWVKEIKSSMIAFLVDNGHIHYAYPDWLEEIKDNDMSNIEFKPFQRVIHKTEGLGTILPTFSTSNCIRIRYDSHLYCDEAIIDYNTADVPDLKPADLLTEDERNIIETFRYKIDNHLLQIIDRLAPKPTEERPVDSCNNKVVEIDGKKYKLTLVE